MKNGNLKNYIIGMGLLLFSSCSPVHRFNRLLECHPYLLDRIKSDTIVVDSGKSIDTVFFVEGQTDTFYVNSGIRIERFRDTFRFVYRERNCTTYIEKTEIRPTTIIEREIREKVNKERSQEVYRLGLYVFLLLLIIGLVRYLFNKTK